MRVLPDFLIVGTKKGGTTSLMNWLIMHPHVLRPYPPTSRAKSPHYFDLHYNESLAWYRSHFPTKATCNLHKRRSGVRPLVGESSPYYMFHPAVAQRVQESVPGVKVIALLRNPVARAYSHYWDRRATGHETLPTFEQAIAAEERRLANVDAFRLSVPGEYSYAHDHFSYLARGRYVEQLLPWLGRFPAEQVLVLKAEELYSHSRSTFLEVQSFLGLPSIELAELPARNERKGYPPILEQTRKDLSDYFRPHNEALYSALGRDFGW
jgi:hypothetical protein